MQILLLLLGCHITRILTGRVQSAVEFANNINTNTNTNVDWFLSGGIKESGAVSEAELMVRMIESKSSGNNNNNNANWNFILDTVATNTAENFIIANQTLNMSSYSDIFIVTSEFHHARANAMASKVFVGHSIKWVLSPLEEPDSRYWEKIHIKNVDSDVKKSMDKMRITQ
jgi:hypothetical protein